VLYNQLVGTLNERWVPDFAKDIQLSIAIHLAFGGKSEHSLNFIFINITIILNDIQEQGSG
jgi:hypothetical protein